MALTPPPSLKVDRGGVRVNLDYQDPKKLIGRYGAYSIKKYGFRIYPYFPRRRGWFFKLSLIYVALEVRIWDVELEREFRVVSWYPIITSPIWFLRRKDKYIEEALEWTLRKLESLEFRRFDIWGYPEEYEEYFSGNFRVLDWKFLGIYIYESEKLSREERREVLEQMREVGFMPLERVI